MNLPPKYKEYAYEQFGETNSIMAEKLVELRSRLLEVSSSSLNTSTDLSDTNLIRFLRARKLNVDNAMTTILNWGKFKADHPEWFDGLSAKEFGKKTYLRWILDMKYYLGILEQFGSLYRVMLEPDSLGRLVCIFPAKRCIEIFTPEFVEANPLAMIRAHMWFVGKFIPNSSYLILKS